MGVLLGNRRFVAYLLAATCADGGFWIAYVAQGWLVLKLTNSPFWLGIVAGSGQVPYAIFALLGGSLADRSCRARTWQPSGGGRCRGASAGWCPG